MEKKRSRIIESVGLDVTQALFQVRCRVTALRECPQYS